MLPVENRMICIKQLLFQWWILHSTYLHISENSRHSSYRIYCCVLFASRTYLHRSTLFFFLRPICYPRTILSPSLPVVTQIRGHIAGSSPPSPLRHVPSFLSREIIHHFLPSSTGVKLCVPTLLGVIST